MAWDNSHTDCPLYSQKLQSWSINGNSYYAYAGKNQTEEHFTLSSWWSHSILKRTVLLSVFFYLCKAGYSKIAIFTNEQAFQVRRKYWKILFLCAYSNNWFPDLCSCERELFYRIDSKCYFGIRCFRADMFLQKFLLSKAIIITLFGTG